MEAVGGGRERIGRDGAGAWEPMAAGRAHWTTIGIVMTRTMIRQMHAAKATRTRKVRSGAAWRGVEAARSSCRTPPPNGGGIAR